MNDKQMMKISVISYPGIKHTQTVKRNQAERFFRGVKICLDQISQKVAELNSSRLKPEIILEAAKRIEARLAHLRTDLRWLERHGFIKETKGIERELTLTVTSINKMIEELTT